MKSGRRTMTSILLALAAAGALFGCQPAQQRINVGKVDTALLLADDPDYQSMSVDYLREQTDLRQKFVEKLKQAGRDESKLRSLQEEQLKVQQEFNGKWQKKTDDFIKTRNDSIRATAEEIAKQKNLDLVIIDSEKYPTVEWGGVDMTKDMALAMSGGSQQVPATTGTPKADAK